MALASVPAPEQAVQVDYADVQSRPAAANGSGRGRTDAEDPPMLSTSTNPRRKRAGLTVSVAPDGKEVQSFTLGPVARIVAPTLGGVLLGSFLAPAVLLGGIVGGLLGLAAGMARDREVQNTAR